MALPLVHVDGEPFDQGRQHGLALAEQIAHNLDVYFDRFQREAELAPAEVRSRVERYVPLLEGHPYYKAMQGVASGSGHDLLDLVVLNLRYELLYYQYSVLPVGGPDGCTSFALLPDATANGHLVIGQNWDWIPEVQGAVLHTLEPDGMETLAFTEAGIVGGKIGLNSVGLGLAINGLLTTSDDWSRLVTPFHVRCWEILRSAHLDAAARIVGGQTRACSANFLMAQPPNTAINIEAAPDSVCQLAASSGSALVHTNHFLDPLRLGVEEPRSERRPHSYSRLARMRSLLASHQPASVEHLQACLRDHDNFPDSVCRHEHPDDPPQEACTTVVSAIMDLDERALWLTDGPPCENVYARYSL